jgi:hypothetical protein
MAILPEVNGDVKFVGEGETERAGGPEGAGRTAPGRPLHRYAPGHCRTDDGGTFTITNLGMYGIDAFTPIINPPEVAILGVGRIFEELSLVNGQVAARSRMVLSLTIDHRIVDGAPGAAFLQTVVRYLEHPALMFIP